MVVVESWDGDQCDVELVRSGSGFLTSSTRMLTALHNVSGHRRGTPIRAYFEAAVEDDVVWISHTGALLWDGGGVHDRSYPYITKFSSNAAEQESPFLPNRLSQLGLRDVQLLARQRLRGPWTFVINKDDYRPLLETSGTGEPILDAALLRAQARSFEFSVDPDPAHPELQLSTGGFPIRAPGVFFDSRSFASTLLRYCPHENNECLPGELEVDDSAVPHGVRSPVLCQADYYCAEGSICRSGRCVEASSQSCEQDSNCPGGYICIGTICHQKPRATPLWLLHHNVFPEEPGPDSFTNNLVSNPYPFVVTGETSDPEKGVRHHDLTYRQNQICRGSTPVDVIFGDLIETTLDALRGSSGGALFHFLRASRPSGVSQHRFALAPTGIFHGVTNPTQPVLENWGDPVGQRLDHLSVITMASPGMAATSRWDDAYDGEPTPGQPTPVQPPDDQDPPRCLEHDAEQCIEFHSSLSTSVVFPDFPEELTPFVWPSSHGSDGSGFPNPDGTEAADEAKHPNRLVQCGVSHPIFSHSEQTVTNSGLGVGFMGSLAYNPDKSEPTADEGSAVGLLRMVCTPWATVPFVTNWNFLQTIGTSSQNTPSHTAIIPNSFGDLAHSLATIAEWRRDEQSGDDYLRPMSMKTCPPNYLLTGVDVHFRSHPDHANRPILAGITALRCVRSRRPHNNETLPEEHLVVPVYDADDACPLEFGDRCFSLGQQIGWSQSPAVSQCEEENDTNCKESIECPTDTVAIGFAYHRDSDGFISNFALDCSMSTP